MHGNAMPTKIDLDNFSFSKVELINLKRFITEKRQAGNLSNLISFFKNNDKIQELLDKDGAVKTALIDLFECAAHNSRTDLLAVIIENPAFKKILEDADIAKNLTDNGNLSPIQSVTTTLDECTLKTVKKIFEYNWLTDKMAKEASQEIYDIAVNASLKVQETFLTSDSIKNVIRRQINDKNPFNQIEDDTKYRKYLNLQNLIKNKPLETVDNVNLQENAAKPNNLEWWRDEKPIIFPRDEEGLKAAIDNNPETFYRMALSGDVPSYVLENEYANVELHIQIQKYKETDAKKPEYQELKKNLAKQLRSQDLVQNTPPFELAVIPKAIKSALNK